MCLTVTNYTYNAANQLVSDGTNTLIYDNNGNMSSDGVNSYTWDRANRLLSMGGASYQYDGEGHRVQQTVSSTVTKYLLDIQPGSSVVLSETTGSNVIRNVFSPRGIHAQKDPSNNWQWIAQDGLGNVREVVDNSVGVLESRNYGPYGDTFGGTMTTNPAYKAPNFGFTGELVDGSGLLDLRARRYNAGLGVFASLDPFEGMRDRAMSLNGYSWVEGNVPNAVDPTGLAFWLGRGAGNLGVYLRSEVSGNNLHVRIQSIAMGNNVATVHAEYPLPIGGFRSGAYGSGYAQDPAVQLALSSLEAQETSYIDLLNEITGEMWEIKPKDDEAIGLFTHQAQLVLMGYSQVLGLLKGTDHPVRGIYDWNSSPSWISGFSFSQVPIYIGTDQTGWWRFFAKQSQPGVIIWWKVQNDPQKEPVPVPIMLPEDVIWSQRNRESAFPNPVVVPNGGLVPVPSYASQQASPICTASCHYPNYTPPRLATPIERYWLGYVPASILMMCVVGVAAPIVAPVGGLVSPIPGVP